jgi:catechol-2,3-dioxygenase
MQIKELILFTANLTNQIFFYEKVLQLTVAERNLKSCSFCIGDSILTLIARNNHIPYHFAINIPSYQEKEALHWLKSRVEILKDEDNEIQSFDSWQAKAVYFYDADKNIVEFIARRTLNYQTTAPFSTSSLLAISEIGLPTFDINPIYQVINTKTKMPIYSGNTDRFCAVGNVNGLFIIINKHKKETWHPTHDKAESADFKLVFKTNGIDYLLNFINEKITLEAY